MLCSWVMIMEHFLHTGTDKFLSSSWCLRWAVCLLVVRWSLDLRICHSKTIRWWPHVHMWSRLQKSSSKLLKMLILITYLLTYSMEQIPSWEAYRFAASQEIPRISWNPKVHYHIHKCPPPVPILSHLDPVHTPTSHFLIIHHNIILPSVPGSPQWSPSLWFPHHNPVHASPLPHTCHLPCPSHSSRFYHSHNIGWGVQII